MVWSFDEASNGPSAWLEGVELYLFQPSFNVTSLGEEDDGRAVWRLSEPMAGVVVIGPAIIHTTIDLPNGVRVELTRESVPDANILGIDGGSHRIDKCYALRVIAGGSTIAEGRWQFNVSPFYGDVIRLSAGLFVDRETLRVYAHVGNIPAGASREWSYVESSPAITAYPLPFGLTGDPAPVNVRNNGVFGRGVSIYADSPGEEPNGTIDIRSWSGGLGYYGIGDLFAHRYPIEGKLDFIPSTLSINNRDADSIAWGRHPAAMAIGPIGWRLSDLETDGHPEWGRGYARSFAGASRLFRNGREAALVPASNHQSNVSPVEAENVRLKTLRVQWTWQGGLTTGPRDIGLLFGAWNEYRMENWGSHSGSGASGEELNGAFIAAAITRIDATNLGSAVDQADAVEITRYALRWFAAVRYRYGADFATTGWSYAERSVILSAADGGKLLAGETVTLSQPTVGDPGYLQGTYPTPSLTNINGTLTIQAIGS